MSLLLTTSVLAVGAGPASAAQAPKKQTKSPTPTATLSLLVKQTNAVPASAIGSAQKAKLVSSAKKAQRNRTSKACVSVAELNVYRRALKKTKVSGKLKGKRKSSAAKKVALLNPSSVAATRALLRSSKTKSCGGGKTGPSVTEATATVTSQDENGLSVRVQLPELQFVPETGGGKTWTRLAVPNTDVPGTPGTPGIPVTSELLGIPDGATYSVEAKTAQSYTVDGVDVYPAQDDPVDQAQPGAGGIEPKPDFTKGEYVNQFDYSPAAYKKKGLTPAAPASGDNLGQSRDLTLGALRLPAAQYDPTTGKLKVLQVVDVKVKFDGGSKTFPKTLDTPWETAQKRLAGGLLNNATVQKIREQIVVRPCGEEMLVITNATTRTAADTFATAKRAQGYLTRVVETGGGTGQIGTTATQIQTYIRGRLNNNFCIRPSYVTIMGDDELVPTFTGGPSGIPSDNPYSTKNDTDELPDVAVGRFIANDIGQLNTAIAKVITYENTPPTGAMLNKATLAAQFQDVDEDGEVNDGQEDRTFIQFAETVRTGLVGRGVAVDRIYEDAPNTNPLKFNDGTDLPASLKKPTFAWDGDAADVSAAWNEGRFLMIHRDHGWSDGWGDPYFTTTNVNALTNGANLPVVMSINCASAQYDTDETSFVQTALVKENGGSVGVFGDTRNSPSWHNSQIGLGFVDALLPTVLSGEGPATKQRVGDALVHGKLRLAGLAPPSPPVGSGGDYNTRKELYLWHYFGDPSMQMWGGGNAPIVLNPAVFKALYKEFPIPDPSGPIEFGAEVTFPAGLAVAGQPVSLLRNGQVVGKAIAGDGSVKVQALFTEGDAPKPGELEIAIEADGAAPIKIPVGDVPAPAPDLVVSSLGSNELTVENKGKAPAAASSTTVGDGTNTLTLAIPALDPGKTATVAYDCSKLGPNRTAKADSAGVVGESDEGNNTTSATKLGCPDLVVTALTNASVTVKNQGQGTAGPSTVKITNSTNETLLLAVGALAEGASATVTYDCNKIGGRGYVADADAQSEVAESVETNNHYDPGQVLIACPN